MLVLGIETSCDETSVCLLGDEGIVCLHTLSQISHAKYGGVVPELSARDHLGALPRLFQKSLDDACIAADAIDVIAVTDRPGLVGSLLVGVNFAKGLALSLGRPLVLVDHLDGHIFTCGLTHNLVERFYCLLVSGGHTQTIAVENLYRKRVFGSTLDDSAGEAFDKLARFLELPYPGGPHVEKWAARGDSERFRFLSKMSSKNAFDFSFSGLKTHFLRAASSLKGAHDGPGGAFSGLGALDVNIAPIGSLNAASDSAKAVGTSDAVHSVSFCERDIADVCASFQKAVCSMLIDRSMNMIKLHRSEGDGFLQFVICGGVACNEYIRTRLSEALLAVGIELVLIPGNLCTDNAAMIANIGRMRALAGEASCL